MAINIQYAGPINEALQRAAAASAYARAAGGGGGVAGHTAARAAGGGGGVARADPYELQANALDAQEYAQERGLQAQEERDARLASYQSQRDEVLHGYQGERIQQQADIGQAHDERAYAQQTFQSLLSAGAPLTYTEQQAMNQYMNTRGAIAADPQYTDSERGRLFQQIDQRLNPLLQRQQSYEHRHTLEENNMRTQAFANRRLDWPDVNSEPVMGPDGQPQRFPMDHPRFAGQIMRQRSIPMILDQNGMPQRIPQNERPIFTPEHVIQSMAAAERTIPPIERETVVNGVTTRMSDAQYQTAVADREERLRAHVLAARDTFNQIMEDQRNPDGPRIRRGVMESIQGRIAPILEELRASTP